MNKRIRVLAEQAGAILEKGYIELSDGQLMLSDNVDLDKSNLDLEKFAELIVQECAVFTFEYTSDEKNIQEYNKIGWDLLSGDLRDAIKEHFGVEE